MPGAEPGAGARGCPRIFPIFVGMKLPELPILEIADAVKSALEASPRLVVTAPPGAGKSTLLPLTILFGCSSDELPGAKRPQFAPGDRKNQLRGAKEPGFAPGTKVLVL